MGQIWLPVSVCGKLCWGRAFLPPKPTTWMEAANSMQRVNVFRTTKAEINLEALVFISPLGYSDIPKSRHDMGVS